MSKRRFHMQVNHVVDKRTIGNTKPMFENCDALIELIANFYRHYESVISAEERSRILSMLTYIEKHGKSVANTEKTKMYGSFFQIANKYRVR